MKCFSEMFKVSGVIFGINMGLIHCFFLNTDDTALQQQIASFCKNFSPDQKPLHHKHVKVPKDFEPCHWEA